MKILFLNHNYEDFGTYYRCYFLGKCLARLGHMVDLVCATKKNFDLTIKRKIIAPNFNIITLPRIRFHEYHTGHSLRAIINSGIVLIKDYDLLHSFAVSQPTTAIPTIVAKYFKNKPIFVDWDDAWGDGFANSHPFLVKKTISFLEKHIPKAACKITVVSDFLRERAIEYGYSENTIVKIPNGANIEEIKPLDQDKAREYLNMNKNEIVLLSIGHTYMETMGSLLDAFSIVLQKEKNAKLYLVGNFGLNHSIKKDIMLRFSDAIVFTGERPFRLIPYYLSASNLLILPMKNSTIEKSRFPIRLGDYMASGRPIVSNAVGEVKNVIETEKCGLTCKTDDPESFASIMLRLIEDTELQTTLGAKARKSAEEKYSWLNIAKQLNFLYKK